MGMSTPMLPRQGANRRRRADALGDVAELGEDLRQRFPLGQREPDAAVAGRSPVQVSTRSPNPAKPISVSRAPPSAAPRRPVSASPRVMSAARAL